MLATSHINACISLTGDRLRGDISSWIIPQGFLERIGLRGCHMCSRFILFWYDVSRCAPFVVCWCVECSGEAVTNLMFLNITRLKISSLMSFISRLCSVFMWEWCESVCVWRCYAHTLMCVCVMYVFISCVCSCGIVENNAYYSHHSCVSVAYALSCFAL